MDQLKAKNMQGVALDKTIEKIAKENGKSPSQLFEILQSQKENK